MKTIGCIESFLFLGLAILINMSGTYGADDIPWQVGRCDNNYAEFQFAGNIDAYKHARPGGATLEIGKGTTSRDWFFLQPGPDDREWAGDGEHPFEIVFNLATQPKGPFLIKIDLVGVNPDSASVLRVRVNDHIRFFQLHAGDSDLCLKDPAAGREQVVEMYVAGGFLHRGRNVVNLVVSKGSWILYDCISMTPCSETPVFIEDLSLQPTYLYKQRNGKLKQVMWAVMDLYEDQEVISTEVTSEQGWKATQEFRNVESGRRKLEVEVDPVQVAQKLHLRLFAGGKTFETDGTILPQKRWKIYLMPSTHFDLGYTDIQSNVLKLHRENNEHAIDWIRRYPGFGWNNEGAYLAEDYLAHGTRPNDFIELASKGRLGVMGFYGNELTGVCSHEGLVRLINYYDFLRHRYGIASGCATESDVPTMVCTVPMVLSGHGIKYLSHGINPTRARGDQEFHRTPFYWESPDGSRVLMWKIVGSYAQSAEITGLEDAGHMGLAMDRIIGCISEFDKRDDYPYDAILLHGAYGDNWPIGESLARVPPEWNAHYAYPKLIFCRGSEFFEYIEKNFADYLPVVKGDGGVWWEDGVASSAYETGIARVAKERLVTAEKIIATCDETFQKRIGGRLTEAWKQALLFDEHTWGAACSIDAPYSKDTLDQWRVKKSFADNAARLTNEILQEAIDNFAPFVSADSVVVFNPSSWSRSEMVEVTTPDGKLGRLFAESVPPLGYKVFPLAKLSEESAKTEASNVLENHYYVVKFDEASGSVTSVYDKELGRELVDSSRYGLNAYLYVSGGENSGILGPGGQKPNLTISTTTNGTLKKLVFPDRQVMQVSAQAPYANSFLSTVILYNDQKRIDFVNKIDKLETIKKEAGYFAFPFAFNKPSIRLEIPNGVIRPEVDQFKGACRDWYAVQHFVTVSDDSAAVAWTAVDSPLITLQDINGGQWYEHLEIENGNVFAYVFNNYWWTNYKANQGGPLTFRFAMTSGRNMTDMQAKQFGESVQNPMIVKVMAGTTSGSVVEKNDTTLGREKKLAGSQSFVTIDGEGIVVQAMMPARFTGGTVIRLREMLGKASTVKLRVTGIRFNRAYLCNLAEDKISPLSVNNKTITVPCKALGLTTVLLERS